MYTNRDILHVTPLARGKGENYTLSFFTLVVEALTNKICMKIEKPCCLFVLTQYLNQRSDRTVKVNFVNFVCTSLLILSLTPG